MLVPQGEGDLVSRLPLEGRLDDGLEELGEDAGGRRHVERCAGDPAAIAAEARNQRIAGLTGAGRGTLIEPWKPVQHPGQVERRMPSYGVAPDELLAHEAVVHGCRIDVDQVDGSIRREERSERDVRQPAGAEQAQAPAAAAAAERREQLRDPGAMPGDAPP